MASQCSRTDKADAAAGGPLFDLEHSKMRVRVNVHSPESSTASRQCYATDHFAACTREACRLGLQQREAEVTKRYHGRVAEATRSMPF